MCIVFSLLNVIRKHIKPFLVCSLERGELKREIILDRESGEDNYKRDGEIVRERKRVQKS